LLVPARSRGAHELRGRPGCGPFDWRLPGGRRGGGGGRTAGPPPTGPPPDRGGRLPGARFPPPSSGRPVPASAPSTWRSTLPRDPLRDLRVADLHAELVALRIGEHHETAAALPPEVGDLRRAEPDQPLHLGVAASLPRPQVEVDPVLHRLALRHLEEEQLGAAAG